MAGFAYLCQAKICFKFGDLPVRTVESKFGLDVRERAIRLYQKNSWKTQGSGAQFMSGGLLWGNQGRDPAQLRVGISGLSRGRESGELLYTLETDDVCGIFALRDSGEIEQRLFHSSDFRVTNPCASRETDLIVCSILYPESVANLATMRADGSELTEITEGDSSDLAPSWVPGSSRTIVFQSAGMGRDVQGRLMMRGPYVIQRLDLTTGEMSNLAEDPKFDFLAPRLDAKGTLYTIRRPYEKPRQGFSPIRAILDLVMLPVNLFHALFQWLNFFTVRYTGKPLTSAGDARGKEVDLKQMLILGNQIDAQKISRETQSDDVPALVPQSWQLIRQPPGRPSQVLARGVLSYDLSEDGTVLYSNGSAIYRLDAVGRKERIHTGSHIEQVVLAE
ncbi:MAG: hypothetical protein U0V70_01680 [Terriglobia bacterium]